MVAAAFIGPGTVVTCSIAGASFGYSLIWALVFSVIATIFLQEMTGRLGAIKGMGLSDAIRVGLSNRYLRTVMTILSLLAILVGNAAYQSGNITGATLGLSELVPGDFSMAGKNLFIIWILGSIAFILLYFGKYKLIEKTLVILVSLMSLIFLFTVIVLPVNIFEIFRGAFIPTFPDNSLFVVMALIGTTIVPYNFFLHSSAVATKWSGAEHLRTVRADVLVSVILGGIISILIIITSAATLYVNGQEVTGLADLATQLRPLLGEYSTIMLSVGIFSAGLTSMITAPVAAAYTVSGLLGKQSSFGSATFRLSWFGVLITGVIVASLGIKPLLLIQIAQFANGLLLPVIGLFLMIVMNQRDLREFRNGWISNTVGGFIILIITFLGLKGILSSIQVL